MYIHMYIYIERERCTFSCTHRRPPIINIIMFDISIIDIIMNIIISTV